MSLKVRVHRERLTDGSEVFSARFDAQGAEVVIECEQERQAQWIADVLTAHAFDVFVIESLPEPLPPAEAIPPFVARMHCPACYTWGNEHNRSCRYHGTGMQHHVPRPTKL